MRGCEFLFTSRFQAFQHLSTRQYARLVREWVSAIGLDSSGYGTHSLRRTVPWKKIPQAGKDCGHDVYEKRHEQKPDAS